MAYCLSVFKKVSPFPLNQLLSVWCVRACVCARARACECVCVLTCVCHGGCGVVGGMDCLILIFCCSHADSPPDNAVILKLNLAVFLLRRVMAKSQHGGGCLKTKTRNKDF